MKLTVTIKNRDDAITVDGLTCRLGEYNGDGDFTHLLVGEATLESVLWEWRNLRPRIRNYHILGTDDSRTVVAAALEVEREVHLGIYTTDADDTTWLFPLDVIAAELPGATITWEIAEVVPHPPRPVNTPDTPYDDPKFWINEHDPSL